MKKLLLLLFIVFALNSCDSGDSDTDATVHYELLPIQYCEMPYRFTAGATYEFEMLYKLPSSCHSYVGIYFEGEGSTKIIAIQTRVSEKNNCQPVTYTTDVGPGPDLESAKFNFTAGESGTVYTFKMWTGKDENGQNTYYDYVVQVR